MSWMIYKSKGKDKSPVMKGGNMLLLEDEWVVEYDFGNRFCNDKTIINTKEQFVLIDGVVLNSQESEVKDFYTSRCGTDMYPICKKLRGPFTGIHIDCNNKKISAFGNQTGDTTVFYYSQDGIYAIATNIKVLLDYVSLNGGKVSLDQEAAEQMLSLGYLVGGHTFVHEIRRTMPGYMVEIDDNKIAEKRYHKFSNEEPLDISFDEAIELVDCEFKKAVKRCFDKDVEYGYKNHLVDMSGGLDSRMVNCVAKKLGYDAVTNLCFAKNNSVEHQYSYTVSMNLGNEFIFKCLDDLHFIFDVEDILRMNNSISIYIGITGGNRLLSDLNFDKFGLEHTGMIGDVVIGSFVKNATTQVMVTDSNIKNIYFNPQGDYLPSNIGEYPNYEMYAMYYRAFQSAVTSHYVRRYYTEPVSPFLDVDFLQVCMSIPVQYRANHKLYFAWIRSKYPEMLTLPTTHPDPSKKSIYSLARKVLGTKTTSIKQMLRKIGLFGLISDKKNMHPLDYWYEERTDIRNFMDNYYSEHIDMLRDYPEIQDKVTQIYNSYGAMNKFQVLTVLGAVKLYFGGER